MLGFLYLDNLTKYYARISSRSELIHRHVLKTVFSKSTVSIIKSPNRYVLQFFRKFSKIVN